MGVGSMSATQSFTMAQESVLGSILIDERVISEVLTVIKPDDFSLDIDRDIFKAARALFLDGEKVDPVTILGKMGSTKELRDRIMQLMDITPTAANVAEYVKIVRNEAKLMRIRGLGIQLAEIKFHDDAQAIISRLNDLLVNSTAMRSVNMEQAITNFYDRIKRPQLYLTWGYQFLDEGLYAEKGDLFILGGRPSDGKTALALSMAYHQAKTMRVGFFSLETKEDKLFDRLFSTVSKVESSHIKRRALTEGDYEALAMKAEEVKDHDLHLIRAAGSSVYDIQAYALARRFDIIYVDYLQLISAEGKGRVEQVTNISIGLQRLAHKNEITVVALSQLSREGDGGKGEVGKKKTVRPPRMSDLRESGQIEQDADIVLFIYREEPDKQNSRRILSVAKNKEGELGRIPMIFEGETQTFRPDIVEIAVGGKSGNIAAELSAVGRDQKRTNSAKRKAEQAEEQMRILEQEGKESESMPFEEA